MKSRGFAEIFAAGLLWGSIGIFVRLLAEAGSTAPLSSFLRMAFAGALIFIVGLWKAGPRAFRIDVKSLGICILMGLLCQGIYNVLYAFAIARTGVGTAAVLLNTAPVFTALASHLYWKEEMGIRKKAALCLNIAACIMAAGGGGFDFRPGAWQGLLCGVAAGFCYGMTPIVGKLASERVNPYICSAYSYIFAAVPLWVWCWGTGGFEKLQISVLKIGFFYGLIPTALAYILYYRGLQKIKESSKVPVIASVEVLAATFFGFLVFREKISPVQISGLVLLVLSIVWMNSGRKERA